MKKNKVLSLILIGLIYLFTLAFGILTYLLLPDVIKNQILLTMLIIDLLCCITIFIFSTILKNSIVVEPFWNLSVIIIYTSYLLITDSINIYTGIFLGIVILWGIRIIINWILNFENLNYKRKFYSNIKEKHPRIYFLIDFSLIHLLLALMAFIGMLPGFFFFEKAKTTGLNFSYILSCLVMLFAITIQIISDIQKNKFERKKDNKSKVLSKGLWKYSRHPNYFGEILFWIGIWLTYFGSEGDFMKAMITSASPILIFCMFVFIIIPIVEKQEIARNPIYKDYIECSNLLLPIPFKNKK